MITSKAVVRARAAVGRICLLAALAAGCGADDDPGSIHVTVTTTGTSLDANGYSVTAASTTKDVPANGEATLADFSPGRYTVELSEVAANCTVTSSNPVTVQLGSGAEAAAAFEVECTMPGLVRVRVSTSGWDYDKDGYLIEVEGDTRQRVNANGVTNLISSRRGTLAVTVADVAPECTADPQNPVSVSAPMPAEISEIALKFACPTITGGLRVNVQPGFALLVDLAEYLPANGPSTTLILDRLTPGEHRVEYGAWYLSVGCTVDGPTPTVATVVVGTMTEITMPLIDCGGF